MALYHTRARDAGARKRAIRVELLFLVSAPAGQWLGGALIDRRYSRGNGARGHHGCGTGLPHLQPSHSGLLDPRGTNTVLNEPGVRDIRTWSVMP